MKFGTLKHLRSAAASCGGSIGLFLSYLVLKFAFDGATGEPTFIGRGCIAVTRSLPIEQRDIGLIYAFFDALIGGANIRRWLYNKLLSTISRSQASPLGPNQAMQRTGFPYLAFTFYYD